jgi:predicted phosphoribosyltransferase
MLEHLIGENCIVLAIPRGGVVVGYEVAKRLGSPLDVIIPRKLGAPGQPELAVGAVSEDGTIYLDEEIVRLTGVDQRYVEKTAKAEMEEIKRRVQIYREGRLNIDVRDKVVILVDDGLATGSTVISAIRHLRKLGPRKIVVAIPVASREALARVRVEADEVYCKHTPSMFYAIGQFYADFEQVSDEEVLSLLAGLG